MSIRVPFDQQKIREFCGRWGISELAFFGSVLREDFRAESDVDVLVRFAPGTRRSFADMEDIKDELRAILGRDVDLVERGLVERSENYIRRRHIVSNLEQAYVA